MATYQLWAIAGFILIIAELMTGTFYLLVLGVAALLAALVALLGGAIWVQVIVGAAASGVGVYLANQWHAKHKNDPRGSNDLNIGQSVVIESWVNQAAGMVRVKYRGTTWDAKVVGTANLNDVLYIQGQENGVFNIGAKP